MAEASIPVDLRNPGQVFACLGFLEAAEVLLGSAEGGFDWNGGTDRFVLKATGNDSPVDRTLSFLAGAQAEELTPGAECTWSPDDDPKRRAVVLRNGADVLSLSHWADGSSREDLKSFGGQQHAFKMLQEGQGRPPLLQEFRMAWTGHKAELVQDPFHLTRPMGGSFKFDARAAWMDRDVGYSLDKQNQLILTSPVIELLAPLGLEHARPRLDPKERLRTRYGVWGGQVPPSLARPALGGTPLTAMYRMFEFVRNSSQDGYYKQVTFAREVEGQ